ncbi:MAG TPA: type II secretion system F family protein [Kofleriaceae bacterium]|nr:type II secretion system F family protein [Kofleriaceae bacterium]
MNALPQAIFGMVLAIFCALGLLAMSRRARATDALRRRLGELAVDRDSLVRDQQQTDDDSFARTLAESGLGWTFGMFLTRLALAAGIGLVLGLLVGSPLLALVLGLAGSAVLWIVVRMARARRLAQCDEQMPQALEIMALALRAGHALPSALRLAGEESPAPLCHELRRAADEHALGRPIVDVLAGLGRRLPGCEAVNTFVVAVAVLQETGGNLIGVIDRIVENARARASYQARLRALTAEGRQSAKLLAMLPGAFAVLAMMSDKSYGNMLLHDGGGRLIALCALGLWGLGILWTRRLVRPIS